MYLYRVLIVLLMTVVLLQSESTNAKPETYVYKTLVSAKPKTVMYVRELLRELGIKNCQGIFIAGDRSTASASIYASLKKDKLNNPLYIQFNERVFDSLSDAQKRFVIARKVMAAQRAMSQAKRIERAGVTALSFIPVQLLAWGFLRRRHEYIVPVLYKSLLASLLLGGPAYLLLSSYLERAENQELDIDAATFSRDASAVIQFLAKKKQERQSRDVGFLKRHVGDFLGLLRPKFSHEKRLQYLRELAEELPASVA